MNSWLRRALYFFVFLGLLSCTQPPAHIPTGASMPPPSGAVAYCARPENKNDENCK